MWAAVGTLSIDVLADYILAVPLSKRAELRERSTSDEDYKHHVIEFYINMHPHPSWGHIGGRLLYWGYDEEALERVKRHIVPEQG